MNDRDAMFARLRQTRRLEWCPLCRGLSEHDIETAKGHIRLLRQRDGQWWTCTCGVQWRVKGGAVSVRVAVIHDPQPPTPSMLPRPD